MKRGALPKAYASIAAILVILGCGGGRLGCNDHDEIVETSSNGWEFNWSHFFGHCGGVSGGRATFVGDNGMTFDAEIPNGMTLTTGEPLMAFPKNTVWGPGSSFDGTPLGTITVTPQGGAPITLNTKTYAASGGLAFNDNWVLPPLRYDLRLDGPFLSIGKTHATGLTTGYMGFTFDVFNQGTTSCSNFPSTLTGNFGINGSTIPSLSVTGTLPPNQGQGTATLNILPAGGSTWMYQTTKPLGATSYTFTNNQQLQIPSGGFAYVGLAINF